MASSLPALGAWAGISRPLEFGALATADSAHVNFPTKGVLGGTPRLLPKAPVVAELVLARSRRRPTASSLPAFWYPMHGSLIR